MYRKMLAAVAALICGGSPVLAAQQVAYHPAPSVLFVRPVDAVPDSTRGPGTYWKEGALITGVPTGLIFGTFVYEFCRDPDGGERSNCGLRGIAGGVAGFLVGAIPGALIGGQFHKPR